MALAYLKHDDAARSRFQEFLKVASQDDVDYARAQRFVERPELARAKMAPNFRLTTLDGRTLTLESLTGKVVLIDFWATWCGPCREALPHIRQIAKSSMGSRWWCSASAWIRTKPSGKTLSEEWDDVDAVSRGRVRGSISKQFNATAIRPRLPSMPMACWKTSMWAMRILKES